jgi:PAS domain S-box-containing protein
MEESLRTDKALLDALMNNITDSIYFKDRQGRHVQVNRQLLDSSGLEADQVIGKTDIEVYGRAFGEKTRADDLHVIKTGEPLIGQVEQRHLPDGRVHWTLSTKVPLRDEQGQIIGLVGITRQINDVIQIQEALRESEKRFRLISELTSDFAYAVRIGVDGDLVGEWGIGAFEEIFGTPLENVTLLENWQRFVHPDDVPEVQRHIRTLLSGHSDVAEFRILVDEDADQRANIRWLRNYSRPEHTEMRENHDGEHGHASPSVDSASDLIRIYGAAQDITERKQAELALKRSEAEMALIFNSMTEMFAHYDKDLTILWANKASADSVATKRVSSPQDLIGHHCYELWHRRTSPCKNCPVLKCMETGTLQTAEIRSPDGRVWFLRGHPVFDETGEVVGAVEFGQDITERKRAEQRFEKHNRDLQLLNRAGQVFSSSLDLDKVLTDVLEEVRSLLQVSASSIWLVDPQTETLICRQATGPQRQTVRGWRLKPHEGIVGWVVRHGSSIIVADAQKDTRHFEGVCRATGLQLRSILSVPLRFKGRVIGVIQVVDEAIGRFEQVDLTLMESLAATAAIAIENARLYTKAQEDAAIKADLLREVNHRVGNNLMAIIGLMRAEHRYMPTEHHLSDEAADAVETTLNRLIQRVNGLVEVHTMLSHSEWAPVRLTDLAKQIIQMALKMLPPGRHMHVSIMESPVTLSPRQASNMALVINELATNSVKHALGGRREGHIKVKILAIPADNPVDSTSLATDSSFSHGKSRLHLDLPGSSDHSLGGDRGCGVPSVERACAVLFEYRDDGPGYPEDVLDLTHHDVGLYLIRRLVTMALQGTLTLINDRGGVARISFELEERGRT